MTVWRSGKDEVCIHHKMRIQRVVYWLIKQVHTKGIRLVILFFFVYSITLLSYDMKTFTVMVNNINKPKNCPRFQNTEKITYGVGDPSIDLT